MTGKLDGDGTADVKFFDEVSDLLKWCQDRVGPLSFTGLAIATLLWLDFLYHFKIPVSFLSSSSLAALPALFMVVSMTVIGLTLLMTMPALVLWTPYYEGGASPLMLGRAKSEATVIKVSGQRLIKADAQATKLRRSMPLRWMLFTALAAVSPMAGFGFLIWRHISSNVWFSMGIFAISTAAGLILFVRPMWKVFDRRPSVTFFMNLLLAADVQILLVMELSTFFFEKGVIDTYYHLLYRMIGLLVVLLIIGLIQLAVAILVVKGLYQGFFKHLTLIALVVMAVLAAIPPVGAALVSLPLRLKAADGETCVVLDLVADASRLTAVSSGLIDARRPGHTMPLSFASHLDGLYYVEADALPGGVYMIPDAVVTGVDSCARPGLNRSPGEAAVAVVASSSVLPAATTSPAGGAGHVTRH